MAFEWIAKAFPRKAARSLAALATAVAIFPMLWLKRENDL